MAVKARAEITLTSIRDVQSVTRYYLLQSSTSAAPAKPTTNPPGGSWATSEPTYTSGSTNSLYFTDCTVFSDDTFVYSDVSLSSSYEAAKVAYNKAENAETIAEKATHSINLIPFGSRSFDDTYYWNNGFLTNGYTSSGVVWNTEQLADGWIHVVGDATGYTGTAKYSSDNVKVRKSPSIKPNTEYTFLYEIRNNNSVLAETSGNNSTFYIQEATGNQFWGNATAEVLEGTGTSGSFVLRTMAPEPNVTYRKRFTKMSDAGTHAGDNPAGLFQMQYRCGNADYLDFELRISIYEGRYLGDYMPYVISDTTDIEADISAANALAQSAKDTADGKITTFYAASTATPTATTTGDLWIKTDDGNSLWRWNGTAWVSVDNADIQSALTAAGTAQATADSKIVTFAQASQPTATDVGDIWIDTDDNNRMYRWNGTAWVDVHDPKIAEANEKIDNLQIGGRNLLLNSEHFTPNSGIFSGSTATVYNKPALDGELPYYASGSKYVKVTFPNLTIGEQYAFSCEVARQSGGSAVPVYITINGEEAIEAGTAKALIWTQFSVIFTATSSTTYAKVQVYTAASSGASSYVSHFRHFKLERGNRATDWTAAPEDIEAEVNAAQETANGKNTVYYQVEAPSGGTYKTNDIWFDTNNGNKMYMWNGATWVAEQFGNAAISDLSITNAKIANGTIQNAKIANLDAGKITTGTMSASRIKGDTLTLGGANNVDGMLKVYDANGTLVGSFTREGLMAIAGTIGGWTIGEEDLTGEWDVGTEHWMVGLSKSYGLRFKEVPQGGDPATDWTREVQYNAGLASFSSKENSETYYGAVENYPGENGLRIYPKLIIGNHSASEVTEISTDQIDTTKVRLTELWAHPLGYGDSFYMRQPLMIMADVVTISTGTSEKNLTLCTVPAAYQSGYRIVPFVSRRYGNQTGTPSDSGDFYYAYYNSVTKNVHIKLANPLPSGTIFQFDYMIYAVPES